jgi:tripartite-type tricarboxylate transporter receptor subunit TctC
MTYVPLTAAVLCLTTGLMAVSAAAQEFYAGKQITLTVSSEPGNGYDTYARAVSHYWGKHIPGQPTFVVKNMQSAGGLKAANFLYNQAAKDGTDIGATQNGTVFEKIFHTVSEGGKNALFDPTRFGWIGAANQGVYLLVAWHDSTVKKFEDLYTHELIVGASSANSDNGINAILLNRVFGAKLKVVYGYPGPALDLAIERGEVQGAAGKDYSSILAVRPQWITEKKVNILIQMGTNPHPDLKDVPSALDLAKTPEDRQVLETIFAKYGMARPYLTPPDVPATRLAALRASFDTTMTDPEFRALAEKQRLEINPMSGKEVEALVNRIFSTPEPLLAKAREAIQPGK